MRTFILIFIGICLTGNLVAQPLTSAQIDSIALKTLEAFDVPGIAVGVVKDGQLIHAKGYGKRSLATAQPVNENTLFGIASNSKAFTTAAISMMVDEGKLTWDDKVRDYIPGFKMYDAYVTEEFTIRDLVTHRSGLGLGAGDLMFFPDSNNFSKQDIIHNLRYLKPVSGFRTKFDYDNLLYIVAGEVIEKVSGMTWESFVENRMMRPIGMQSSAASFKGLRDVSNVADPHAPVDGIVKNIRRDWSNNCNAAGGIYSNITDLSKWVMLLLNEGKYGNGQSLFSKDMLQEMWNLQTIIPVNGNSPYNTHFAGYGLGWFLADVKGYKQVSHTGGLAGVVTQVTLIPELKLGIIVLTNQQAGGAFTTLTSSIKDGYLGVKGADRLKEMTGRAKRAKDEAESITKKLWASIDSVQKNNKQPINYNIYTGSYVDPWFGKVTVSLKGGKPWFQSERSPLLSGEMIYYKGNSFIVKWTDRSMDADAFANFSLDKDGKAMGIKMEAISPLTDFSFDFQDLDFKRAD